VPRKLIQKKLLFINQTFSPTHLLKVSTYCEKYQLYVRRSILLSSFNRKHLVMNQLIYQLRFILCLYLALAINSGIAFSQNGSNNSGTLTISNFQISSQIYEGNPEQISSMSVTSDALNSSREYVIQYDHQHDNIPIIKPNILTGGLRNAFFQFQFTVDNVPSGVTDLNYIIFYQNRAYKFSENGSRSAENFYGSWGWNEDDEPSLRSVTVNGSGSQTITGYFRMRGNPRNESIYCGSGNCNGWIDNNYITSSSGDGVMQRWKRLPRMGEYEFMLIVTTDDISDFQNGNSYLINPSGVNQQGNLQSPFNWRNLIGSSLTDNTAVVEANESIALKIDIEGDAMNAMITPVGGPTPTEPRSPFKIDGVNFHLAGPRKKIPLQLDINNYTQLDYNWNAHFFNEDDLLSVFYNVGDTQDEDNIKAENQRIIMTMPPGDCSMDPVMLEYAAMIYGRGLTYGKYTIEMQFPKLYNPKGVSRLNGNTFWFSQFQGQPEMQYFCESLAKYINFDFNLEVRQGQPSGTYFDDPIFYPYPSKMLNINYWNTDIASEVDGGENKDKIELLFSYDDGGCMDPPNALDLDEYIDLTPPSSENSFYPDIKITRKYYSWSDNTGKKTEYLYGDNPGSIPSDVGMYADLDDDDYFSDDPNSYYYYQFEWTPEAIYFRMGPDLNNLQLYSYIHEDYFVIPNVPMTLHLDLRYWGQPAEPWVRHGSQLVPFHNQGITGRLKRLIIE